MTEANGNGTPNLQQQVEKQTAPERKKFGTFAGVFTPTILTILGVIMYLREGSVVGNAGLLGAWLIIALAFGITAATALSMSSITTNIRIGAGGAYSIISQSLGLEVGGSVGIPLYLSQALAVTMYIFGFREGWLSIFPNHPALAVDLITFAVLFSIAFISANLAFRIQYVIMAIIIASLVSVFGTFFTGALEYPIVWWGNFEGFPETGFSGTGFWFVFAVFFPAATGIMAGANMSGDLENPRRSIPLGSLWAIGLSFIIYMALAYWLARVASPEELLNNYTVMIDKALWGPIVLAGLLGATFSSGLSSLVGAPRILQALGQHDVVPQSKIVAKQSKSGEPRNAMWFTGLIVLASLMLRDLNAIAPLITMFFLIAYAMINVVVLIEQNLGLVSFRPLFQIPRLISLLGAVGCLFAMFIVNPVFSLVAVVIVVIFYGLLVQRQLQAPFGDVRSGMFVAVAEWAAKRVATDFPLSQERAWKPNLLIPVEDSRELRGTFRLIHNITYEQGSIKLVGLELGQEKNRLQERLPTMTKAFRDEGVFSSWTIIEGSTYSQTVLASMQALSGVFFRPNIVFLKMPSPDDEKRLEEVSLIIQKAHSLRLGIILFAPHQQVGLGRKQEINVWIRDQGPNWSLSMRLGNLDLALLTAYKLTQNWSGSMRLISAVRDEAQTEKAEQFLSNLADLARFPAANVSVFSGAFKDTLAEAPMSDLSIFGLPQEPNLKDLLEIVNLSQTTCIFVRDSGEENALA